MLFRKALFWLHLAAGILAGALIAVMCFTGTALAFEKDLVAWSERDARRIAPPAPGTPRLPLEELQRRLQSAHPNVRPASIIVQNDPATAVAFSSGRTGAYYINPYTGEIRQPRSQAVAEFMRVMVEWHRYLGFRGDESRPRGKLVNGIANVTFCVLALTGLYLWMPRQWAWRALRPIVWFRQNASGKARDFNWHNAIGFWSAPVLIVLTLTAMPISFRWAGNAILTLTGTPAPVTGALAVPTVPVPTPPPGTPALPSDILFTAAQRHVPAWQTVTLRLGTAPWSFTIREADTWPRTATTTLTLDPYTGQVLRRTSYADLNAAQQVRAWTRFLHTGEALGAMGQFIAGLASLAGCFLVYTGFALTWRRFFRRAPTSPAAS